jgi:hypothetical protein
MLGCAAFEAVALVDATHHPSHSRTATRQRKAKKRDLLESGSWPAVALPMLLIQPGCASRRTQRVIAHFTVILGSL